MPRSSEQEKAVKVVELTICYHIMKHDMLFSSLDCAMNLRSKSFNDFGRQKISHIERTKATAIVTSILAPDTTKHLLIRWSWVQVPTVGLFSWYTPRRARGSPSR